MGYVPAVGELGSLGRIARMALADDILARIRQDFSGGEMLRHFARYGLRHR